MNLSLRTIFFVGSFLNMFFFHSSQPIASLLTAVALQVQDMINKIDDGSATLDFKVFNKLVFFEDFVQLFLSPGLLLCHQGEDKGDGHRDTLQGIFPSIFTRLPFFSIQNKNTERSLECWNEWFSRTHSGCSARTTKDVFQQMRWSLCSSICQERWPAFNANFVCWSGWSGWWWTISRRPAANFLMRIQQWLTDNLRWPTRRLMRWLRRLTKTGMAKSVSLNSGEFTIYIL